jgi:dienelactone hydrolase
MTRRWLGLLVLIAVATAGCGGSGSHAESASTTRASTTSTSTTTTTVAPPNGLRIAPAFAPAGYATPTGTWLNITRPNGATQLVAVFHPSTGAGPFPVVVFLHGSSGLPKPELALAPRLADAGFVVVAGCYLDADPSVSKQIFMPCPGVPNDQRSSPSATSASVRTLVDASTTLPGIEPGAIGELGISLGANNALSADDPRIHAVAADSGHRTVPGVTSAPVLLLGMTTDPNVNHGLVVATEQAQRAAGRSVDAHYYPGTGHVTIFGPPPIATDAFNRIVAFFHANLH